MTKEKLVEQHKKQEKLVEQHKKQEKLVEQHKKQEPVYSREELINAASSFGVKPEVVAGALRLAGKDSLTKAEAEKAIKRFLERKV